MKTGFLSTNNQICLRPSREETGGYSARFCNDAKQPPSAQIFVKETTNFKHAERKVGQFSTLPRTHLAPWRNPTGRAAFARVLKTQTSVSNPISARASLQGKTPRPLERVVFTMAFVLHLVSSGFIVEQKSEVKSGKSIRSL